MSRSGFSESVLRNPGMHTYPPIPAALGEGEAYSKHHLAWIPLLRQLNWGDLPPFKPNSCSIFPNAKPSKGSHEKTFYDNLRPGFVFDISPKSDGYGGISRPALKGKISGSSVKEGTTYDFICEVRGRFNLVTPFTHNCTWEDVFNPAVAILDPRFICELVAVDRTTGLELGFEAVSRVMTYLGSLPAGEKPSDACPFLRIILLAMERIQWSTCSHFNGDMLRSRRDEELLMQALIIPGSEYVRVAPRTYYVTGVGAGGGLTFTVSGAGPECTWDNIMHEWRTRMVQDRLEGFVVTQERIFGNFHTDSICFIDSNGDRRDISSFKKRPVIDETLLTLLVVKLEFMNGSKKICLYDQRGGKLHFCGFLDMRGCRDDIKELFSSVLAINKEDHRDFKNKQYPDWFKKNYMSPGSSRLFIDCGVLIRCGFTWISKNNFFPTGIKLINEAQRASVGLLDIRALSDLWQVAQNIPYICAIHARTAAVFQTIDQLERSAAQASRPMSVGGSVSQPLDDDDGFGPVTRYLPIDLPSSSRVRQHVMSPASPSVEKPSAEKRDLIDLTEDDCPSSVQPVAGLPAAAQGRGANKIDPSRKRELPQYILSTHKKNHPVEHAEYLKKRSRTDTTQAIPAVAVPAVANVPAVLVPLVSSGGVSGAVSIRANPPSVASSPKPSFNHWGNLRSPTKNVVRYARNKNGNASGSVAGGSCSDVGSSRPVAGSSGSIVGSSRSDAGRSRPVTGGSSSIAGSSLSVVHPPGVTSSKTLKLSCFTCLDVARLPLDHPSQAYANVFLKTMFVVNPSPEIAARFAQLPDENQANDMRRADIIVYDHKNGFPCVSDLNVQPCVHIFDNFDQAVGCIGAEICPDSQGDDPALFNDSSKKQTDHVEVQVQVRAKRSGPISSTFVELQSTLIHEFVSREYILRQLRSLPSSKPSQAAADMIIEAPVVSDPNLVVLPPRLQEAGASDLSVQVSEDATQESQFAESPILVVKAAAKELVVPALSSSQPKDKGTASSDDETLSSDSEKSFEFDNDRFCKAAIETNAIRRDFEMRAAAERKKAAAAAAAAEREAAAQLRASAQLDAAAAAARGADQKSAEDEIDELCESENERDAENREYKRKAAADQEAELERIIQDIEKKKPNRGRKIREMKAKFESEQEGYLFHDNGALSMDPGNPNGNWVPVDKNRTPLHDPPSCGPHGYHPRELYPQMFSDFRSDDDSDDDDSDDDDSGESDGEECPPST